MIRFDAKNSVNKSMFIKAMQYPTQPLRPEEHSDGQWDNEKYVLSATLKQIEDSKDKNAVGLLNSLFLSSTSHVLDKVCLNIFSRLGDHQSLELLHKKYPAPDSIGITLLPYYIRVLQFLGREQEIEMLARIANTFWGLYRAEILDAMEEISHRIDRMTVTHDVVNAMQYLYDTGDEHDKIKVLSLASFFSHQLLLSVVLCGIESDHAGVRKAAIAALGTYGGGAAYNAMRRAFQNEADEALFEEYETWLFRNNINNASPDSTS